MMRSIIVPLNAQLGLRLKGSELNCICETTRQILDFDAVLHFLFAM